MTRTNQLACRVTLVALVFAGVVSLGAAPVTANPATDGPRSLRMRVRPRPHVAQAATPEPPAPDPEAAVPPAPAPTPGAPPQAAQAATPELTDAELAQLSQQEDLSEMWTGPLPRLDSSSPWPVTVIETEQRQFVGLTKLGDVLHRIPAQGDTNNAPVHHGGDGATRFDLRTAAAWWRAASVLTTRSISGRSRLR
jgi:hypothetical protein